jgi:hypothetical protein
MPLRFVERGRSPKLFCRSFAGGELVAMAKSMGLSPLLVESYDYVISAARARAPVNHDSVWESVVFVHDRLFDFYGAP